MHTLDAAILRTLLYADVFSYPMTLEEIHFYLIHDEASSLEALRQRLQQSQFLDGILLQDGPYIALQGKEEAILTRQYRSNIAQKLMPLAQQYGMWLAQIPFVRMVALTGALAMRNPAHAHDDFDYMLVTQPGRVWLSRLIAVLFVRMARLRGIELCPNYVVATDQLLQDRQDLFIAHEVRQMIPIYGEAVYQDFQQQNHWAACFMVNAQPRNMAEQSGKVSWAKSLAEWALRGRMGNWLEAWEYRRKSARFAKLRQQSNTDAARIDAGNVKGHFEDHGWPVLRQYHERLRAYGLENTSQRSA